MPPGTRRRVDRQPFAALKPRHQDHSTCTGCGQGYEKLEGRSVAVRWRAGILLWPHPALQDPRVPAPGYDEREQTPRLAAGSPPGTKQRIREAFDFDKARVRARDVPRENCHYAT